jgi:hypothetical protein
LTDTPAKNTLKNYNVNLGENKKNGTQNVGKRSVPKISSERFTKETPKNTKKSKNASDRKEEDSKGTICLPSLSAYSRSASREMWIQCIECKLWAHEQYTDGSSVFIYSNCQTDGSEYFV